MLTVALQQVTSDFARENAGKTLEKPIRLKYIERFIEPEKLEVLRSACEDGKVFVWGAKLERIHQVVKMLPPRCLVLFRRGNRVYKCGVITEVLVSIGLAGYLWANDIDGQTWALVYFLKDVKDVSIPASEINRLIGRKKKDHWQGLVAVASPAADQVIAYVKGELAKRSNNMVDADARKSSARASP